MTLEDLEADDDGDPTTSLRRDPTREYFDGAGIRRLRSRRIDMLMFFTTTPGKSYRDPSITGRLQQVVYGHAELGVLDPVGAWRRAPLAFPQLLPGDAFDSNATAAPVLIPAGGPVFFPPAQDWHLARRSVLILDQSGPFTNVPPALSLDDSAAALSVSDDEVRYSGLAAANWIRDGRRDYVINTVVDTLNSVNNPTEDFRYEDYVLGMTPRNPASAGYEVALNVDDCCGASGTYPNFTSNQFTTPPNFRHWIVPWFARSQVDPSPPASESHRLGHFFMSNCAGFKVEWALSSPDPAVNECLELFDDTVWVDPSDVGATARLIDAKIIELNANPALADELAACGVANAPLNVLRNMFQDAIGRFGSQIVGTNHLFYAKDPNPGAVSSLSDPLFPSSLRITIDVYDSSRRLERPIRHVMILPIGD
ncbi:MAG: hypothetical protein GXP29_03990 [Planctomycetes bacterium]|nr:hypothetical protein [Planctomycetota bacterium]